MSSSRTIKTLLGFSLVFLVLGTGNIWYGNHKANAYKETLSKVLSSLTSEPIDPYKLSDPNTRLTDIPISVSPPVLTKQSAPKLRARIDFYEFVALGGGWILALSATLFLIALIMLRIPPE